jgi:long-subunit fatty acid transport protein
MQIGVMARSGYLADLSGTAQSRYFADLDSAASEVDLSSKFEIPWVFGGGLVYKLSESLTINADLQYSMWSNTQESMDFDFNNSIWQNNLPSNDSLSGIRADKFILDFNNTIDAGIGLNLKLSDLDLRFGYRFSQSPNSESTYSYLFPAVDQHRISIGLGYVDENLSADLSVAYAFGTEKEINGTTKGFNGKYNGSLVIPVLTIRYSL